MIGKKYICKLLDSNMGFVYLFCCENFNFNGTYEEFLKNYKDFLKYHTTPKGEVKK